MGTTELDPLSVIYLSYNPFYNKFSQQVMKRFIIEDIILMFIKHFQKTAIVGTENSLDCSSKLFRLFI